MLNGTLSPVSRTIRDMIKETCCRLDLIVDLVFLDRAGPFRFSVAV